ncbi:hypothetical protein Plhal710r2_c069g0177201 [Plasmopara halstedii]
MLLVPRFPRYQLMLHNDREQQGWSKAVKQCSVLQDIATHSRGRFARHFVDKVVECTIRACAINLCDFMDEACVAVSLRTHDGKKFLYLHDGKRWNVENEQWNLDLDMLFFGNRRRHAVESRNIGWEIFPSYYDHETREKYSTKYIFAVTSIYPVHENTNFKSHDYKAFENMVAHAIFCSSRRNGVRGIPLNDFFACLLGEFQDKLCKKMRMYDAQRLSCTIIPFLAPPNAKWPKYNLGQNSHGCTFGHLFRVSNKECVMSTFKTRESKMKNQFSSASAIVFVFFMKLARNPKPWGHRSVGCVKINYRDGEVKWIFQPPKNRDRKQLFIVFETTDQGMAWKRTTTNSLKAFNTKAVALF